jgi:hypothetical protein
MNSIEAFLILAVLYYIGEFISTWTKAWIPSVFVIATLFLLGYWSFFPADIVPLAGLGPPLGGLLVIMLCITHMGTIISIRQLMDQWKVVAVSLAGLAGMIALCWFVCVPLVGKAYVIAGLPPLTGGIVAATMMQQAAAEKGLMEAAVLAIAMYAVQGFVGYPLTAIVLKHEGRKLLAGFRSGAHKSAQGGAVDHNLGNMKTAAPERKRLFPPMPEKFSSTAFILAKLMFVAWLSSLISRLTGGTVNAAVITLILGVVFTELGFLDNNSLQKAGSYGFLMYVLMIFVFAGLRDATPQMLASCIGPMLTIIAVGVTGLIIMSVAMGKVLGLSWAMASAVSLTALYGFPPNYILTDEACKALAETPEEKQYLMDQMLPQMIVGGFVTVTITSVFVAGIFVNLL